MERDVRISDVQDGDLGKVDETLDVEDLRNLLLRFNGGGCRTKVEVEGTPARSWADLREQNLWSESCNGRAALVAVVQLHSAQVALELRSIADLYESVLVQYTLRPIDQP